MVPLNCTPGETKESRLTGILFHEWKRLEVKGRDTYVSTSVYYTVFGSGGPEPPLRPLVTEVRPHRGTTRLSSNPRGSVRPVEGVVTRRTGESETPSFLLYTFGRPWVGVGYRVDPNPGTASGVDEKTNPFPVRGQRTCAVGPGNPQVVEPLRVRKRPFKSGRRTVISDMVMAEPSWPLIVLVRTVLRQGKWGPMRHKCPGLPSPTPHLLTKGGGEEVTKETRFTGSPGQARGGRSS